MEEAEIIRQMDKAIHSRTPWMPTHASNELEMEFYISKFFTQHISQSDALVRQVARHLYEHQDAQKTSMWLKNRFDAINTWPPELRQWKNEAILHNDVISHPHFSSWDDYVASLQPLHPDFITLQLQLTTWVRQWPMWRATALQNDTQFHFFLEENTPGTSAHAIKTWELKHLVWRELKRWHDYGPPENFRPFPKVHSPPQQRNPSHPTKIGTHAGCGARGCKVGFSTHQARDKNILKYRNNIHF